MRAATAVRRRNLWPRNSLRRAHAERPDAGAHFFVAQRRKERLHRRAPRAALDHEKIVVFRRQRQKAEAVELGHRLDGDAPIGARSVSYTHLRAHETVL